MIYLDEDKVRELVEEAVRIARNTTPSNVSDEAVAARTMDDKYVDGRWGSSYFAKKEIVTPMSNLYMDRFLTGPQILPAPTSPLKHYDFRLVFRDGEWEVHTALAPNEGMEIHYSMSPRSEITVADDPSQWIMEALCRRRKNLRDLRRTWKDLYME